MNTPQADVAMLQECVTILRQLTTRRTSGRPYRYSVDDVLLIAMNGEDAALRLDALVSEQDYAGCMVAGAEDGE